jgi:hypothetical protein
MTTWASRKVPNFSILSSSSLSTLAEPINAVRRVQQGWPALVGSGSAASSCEPSFPYRFTRSSLVEHAATWTRGWLCLFLSAKPMRSGGLNRIASDSAERKKKTGCRRAASSEASSSSGLSCASAPTALHERVRRERSGFAPPLVFRRVSGARTLPVGAHHGQRASDEGQGLGKGRRSSSRRPVTWDRPLRSSPRRGGPHLPARRVRVTPVRRPLL